MKNSQSWTGPNLARKPAPLERKNGRQTSFKQLNALYWRVGRGSNEKESRREQGARGEERETKVANKVTGASGRLVFRVASVLV